MALFAALITEVDAQKQKEETLICKVHREDCAGIGTGERDLCIQGGEGAVCQTCGSVSGCYGGWGFTIFGMGS